MARTKKRIPKENGWTAGVMRGLVDEASRRRRQFEARSRRLLAEIELELSFPVEKIRAAATLLETGDVSLDHYLASVREWSADKKEMDLSVPELNVINWAKAWARAKTKTQQLHAGDMLRTSVDNLGNPR